ncbi:MAG: hypothetical protein LC808_39970 [Actinobacteria bacterium]|nr:hypothetical protein [Actinomycetota bacterium]
MAVSKVEGETRLRRAKRYSWRLLLTIAGSVLGTVVPGLVGAGPIATLIGAILVALFSAFFTSEGPVTRAKALTASTLTLIAVILTVSGFTLADDHHDRSVVSDRQFTFPFPLTFPVLLLLKAIGASSLPTLSSNEGTLSPDAPSVTDPSPSFSLPSLTEPAPVLPNPPPPTQIPPRNPPPPTQIPPRNPPPDVGVSAGPYTFAGLADFNHDGNVDIVTKDTAGTLWLYPRTSNGSFGQRAKIGIGW